MNGRIDSRGYSDKAINCILLAAYLSFIFICQIIVSDHFQLCYFEIGSCLWILISLILAPIIIDFFSRLYIGNESFLPNHSQRVLRLYFYGIPLVVMLLYYIAYYPGVFPPDSIWQNQQVVTKQFNDWHPVLHTVSAFWLPLKISGGWIGSIVLFQILSFSMALGYCFETIYKYTGKCFVIGSMVFVLCNPLLCIAVAPLKDVSFAVGTLLLMTFSLEIYFSGGEWLNNPAHTAFCVFAFVFTTIVRHNAVLFTAPLLLATLFHISKKKKVVMIIAICVLFSTIKGPLYSVLNVEKPDRRQVETLGLPMTVIGAAVTYTPDSLDEDILEFAYRIAPREIWTTYYKFGDLNAFKYRNESNEDVIEEYGAKSVLNMMVRCIKTSPAVCASSLIKLTEGVYTITDAHPCVIEPGVSGTVIFLSNYLYGLRSFIRDFMPHIFLYYGVADLLIIITVLSKCRLNRLKDRKKAWFAFPVLIYNFGTSLLLTGNSDSPRFFYYTVLSLPVILVFFFRKEEASE